MQDNKIYDIADFLIQHNIAYKNISIYETAFIHSSFANENNIQSNERLEFLGDAVLNLVITRYLYELYPDKNEGFLTQAKAYIICSDSLISAGKVLCLNDFLKTSLGYKNNPVNNTQKTFEDCYESLIGAIFLDIGYDIAKDFILKSLHQRISDAGLFHKSKNYKTLFQEIVQKKLHIIPEYRPITSPNSSNLQFCFGVYVKDKIFGIGHGENSKVASVNAAENAMKNIESNPHLLDELS